MKRSPRVRPAGGEVEKKGTPPRPDAFDAPSRAARVKGQSALGRARGEMALGFWHCAPDRRLALSPTAKAVPNSGVSPAH